MYVTTRDYKGNIIHPCACSCRSKEEHEQKIAAKLGKLNKGKTMDSAKKSVEKVLEIAKKHGYACVVGFRKSGDTEEVDGVKLHRVDMWCGATGSVEEVQALVDDSITPMLNHYKGDNDGE